MLGWLSCAYAGREAEVQVASRSPAPQLLLPPGLHFVDIQTSFDSSFLCVIYGDTNLIRPS
jgi:hypothetical protein